MQITKKEQEHKYLERFRRSCANFPIGEVVSDETPDFIVDSTDRRIGIEVTRIYIDPPEKRNSLQSWEQAKNRITNRAEEIFQEKNLPETYVGLFFNSSCWPNKRNEERIARAVAQIVVGNLPSAEQHVYVRFELGSGHPIEVDLISIFRTTNFGTEHWQPHEAGEVQRSAIEHIQSAIDKKARKLKSCLTRCDECWLLIVAPSRTPAGFIHPDVVTLQHTYPSDFRHSWFMDDFSGSVTLLNTLPASKQERYS